MNRKIENKRYLLWWKSTELTGIGIVASVNYVDDELFDWAVYIGICPDYSDASIDRVAEVGAKLQVHQALAFAEGRFGLNEDKYRV